MNPAFLRRLEAIERAVADLPVAGATAFDVEEVRVAWRRLMAYPPSPPRSLPPEIAAMTDAECVEAVRRMCKRQPGVLP
jgi:hypothetical protein